MKYFLIVSLFLLNNSSFSMKKKLLSRHENLEREIFMNTLYKDYSFELIQQMKASNPINQKVFASLISRGRQRYAALVLQNHTLEPFDKYSLSDLESIKVN